MASDRTFWRRMRQSARVFVYAQRLIDHPTTSAEAAEGIRSRLARRPDIFLETLERTVYAHADSPYRPLLDAAGYDLSRVRSLVGKEGVESALRRLCSDGVYVSVQEFKGIQEARRGDRVFRFNERNFTNPITGSGLSVSSGGTSGRPIATEISLSNFQLGVAHLATALAAYGLEGKPAIMWLTITHGASLWGVLSLAAVRNPVAAWFSPFPVSLLGGDRLPASYLSLRLWGRLRGSSLPGVTQVPFGQESRILAWMGSSMANGCAILTTPSCALRLALAAARKHTRLTGITFVTIGEPLTPAKLATIQSTGARAFSSLGFTEFGRATYGCASPVTPDEMHVCRDALAVVQRKRVVDHAGTEVDALMFTSLLPNARRILLNMETGDYGRMTTRSCGCPLEVLGWTDHLQDIRSFEKLNAEGRLFFGSQLISLVEQTLPQRFGGDPTDYQLVEQEDEEGLTRLSVHVHPRLAGIDENAVRDCVEVVLSEAGPAAAVLWRKADTVRVRRAPPIVTRVGKLMPLHHLDLPDQSSHQDLVTVRNV
jgi:hypothetical protein